MWKREGPYKPLLLSLLLLLLEDNTAVWAEPGLHQDWTKDPHYAEHQPMNVGVRTPHSLPLLVILTSWWLWQCLSTASFDHHLQFDASAEPSHFMRIQLQIVTPVISVSYSLTVLGIQEIKPYQNAHVTTLTNCPWHWQTAHITQHWQTAHNTTLTNPACQRTCHNEYKKQMQNKTSFLQQL